MENRDRNEQTGAGTATDAVRLLVCDPAGEGAGALISDLAGRGGAGATPAADGPLTITTTNRTIVAIPNRRAGDEIKIAGLVTQTLTCDAALLILDAEGGLDHEARRLICILGLLGVHAIVVALDGPDPAAISAERFEEIAGEIGAFAKSVGTDFGAIDVQAVPVCAAGGDNVVGASLRFAWFGGATLLEALDRLAARHQAPKGPLRFSVANRTETGACIGSILDGRARVGDDVVALPSGAGARLATITCGDGKQVREAGAGAPITLGFEPGLDAPAGSLISASARRPEVADQAAAHVIWSGTRPMLPGRPYRAICNGRTATATVSALRHKINVDNLDKLAGRDLEAGEIGLCNLSFDGEMVFDPFAEVAGTGSFTLAEKNSGETVAIGFMRFGLRRATNIRWQSIDVSKALRAGLKGQKPCCLWFTGLSGSGKSTVANLLDKRLNALGRHTYVLDGDNVRHGLCRDLGFTDADRVENIRRVAEVARLMVDSGLVVMASFISPFRAERRMARAMFEEGEFLEVHVDTPLEVCEARDPKGLYAKARAGEIANFTGISSAYEVPDRAEMTLASHHESPENLVERILEELQRRGHI